MADFVDREITVMDEPGPLPGSHHPRSESFRSRAGETTIMTEDIGHDVTRLYTTVETAMMNMPAPSGGDNNAELRPTEVVRMKEMLCETWESIREWLAAHPSMTDRQQAAMHQGQFLTTALHMVCKLMDPPVDVVQSLIDCAVETVMWPDSNGWLPLHHACANGATGKVLSVLVQAYPEGKVHQDKRLRTPLHFAFFRKDAPVDQTSGVVNPDGHSNENMNRGGDDMDNDNEDVGNSMPDIVALLADSGAAELQDEGGMVSLVVLLESVF